MQNGEARETDAAPDVPVGEEEEEGEEVVEVGELEADAASEDGLPVAASPDPVACARISALLCLICEIGQAHVGSAAGCGTRGAAVLGVCAGDRRAAGCAGDVVQFVHGVNGRALVEKVHQDESRLASPCLFAVVGCCE